MYFDDTYSLYFPYYSVWTSTNMFSSQLHILPPRTFCVAHMDVINRFIIIHVRRENLSMATCLRQIDSSSPSSQQLLISPQLRLIRLLRPCYNFDKLNLFQVLCKQPCLLWICKCNEHVMPRRWHFKAFLLILSLLHSFQSFFLSVPWGLGEKLV